MQTVLLEGIWKKTAQGFFLVTRSIRTHFGLTNTRSKFIPKKVISPHLGLLNAPRGSQLHEHLKKEGRLLDEISGDNMDMPMNSIPRMNWQTLLLGCQRILVTPSIPFVTITNA